nr:hypothetical protein [uncultured Blautia sp.]
MIEIPEIELLTPLSAEFYPDEPESEEVDMYDGVPLDGSDLAQYEGAIQKMVDQYNDFGQPDGTPCNLMDYFDSNPAIKEKVTSAVVSVKNVDDALYGCTTLHLKEFLEADELTELCEYITGQYSDGWGEGFEQREIQVDGGYLNVHFWQPLDTQFQVREKSSEQEKIPDPQIPKRPKMNLVGMDGNIFAVLGRARKLLVQNGQGKEAAEMCDRVHQSENYYQALHIISEYVETELSEPHRENCKPPKKEKKGESR